MVVKTLQLIGKLLPTASAQFKRRLKTVAAGQIAAAKVRDAASDALALRGGGSVILRVLRVRDCGVQSYNKLDEKYGDKPAKMVQKLATGVEGALMGA